ncbi:MAG: hypothetical protein LBC64_05690 [Fibromonadaceae bacterium]|jgi:hypothetical protein|nr:hypothetical protein [Fibromonadaceae bacterium]
MENKVYVMTAKQAAKAFPIDEKLYARLKELEDSGFEPDIYDEHPEVTDDARFVRVSDLDIIIDNIFGGIFKRIFKKKPKAVLHTP